MSLYPCFALYLASDSEKEKCLKRLIILKKDFFLKFLVFFAAIICSSQLVSVFFPFILIICYLKFILFFDRLGNHDLKIQIILMTFNNL